MSDDGAYLSHLEIRFDTHAGSARQHGPQADPDAPPLRAPAVAALEALVALARADGVRAELELHATAGQDWPAGWELPSAWVRDPTGAAVGILAHEACPGVPAETPAQEAARAADTAHEHLVEHRPGTGRSTSWPSCPHHPETHPLALVPGSDSDPRPRWTCPRTREVVGPLG